MNPDQQQQGAQRAPVNINLDQQALKDLVQNAVQLAMQAFQQQQTETVRNDTLG